jgi:hypothetical protein
MSKEDTLRVVHGIRMLIPAEWEDSSLYRFNAPPLESEVSDAAPMQLQPNVLISRHEKNLGDSPDRFLELTNADAKKQNATFEVVRSGTVIYLDQISAWQDTRFVDPRTSAAVFQRLLVTPSWPKHLTLITLTGTQAGVERISADIGLAHLTDAPGGARVKTSEGVVAGQLVSK